jgi:hypothetical protein
MMCRYACVLPSTENTQNECQGGHGRNYSLNFESLICDVDAGKDVSCCVRVMMPCSVVCLYERFGGTDCHYLQGQGEVVDSMSQHVDPSQKTKIRIEIKSIKSKLDPWTCLLCLKLRNISQYKDGRVIKYRSLFY